MNTAITFIEYHLAENTITSDELSLMYPEWSVEKIVSKTGISKVHHAGDNECASDLAEKAVNKLLDKIEFNRDQINCLILCTQSPDYFLPTTSCILQDRLGLLDSTATFDFNLGCSGYIYGLGIAKGMIQTGQVKNVMLVTSDTYSKYIHPKDKSVRTIFSDAASASLITEESSKAEQLGPFVYGTDGSGYKNLIVPCGGARNSERQNLKEIADGSGNIRTDANLYMNGHEIFNFTLKKVPQLIEALLNKSKLNIEEIDYFVLHQANLFMLKNLRRKIKIPKEKFIISIKEYGNTVSSTIPIALKNKTDDGTIKKGDTLMLVGFGVGYSWGACIIKWS
jgi:3-oxoacyl-[acyl-carrier-protein] synthase-3